MKFLQCTSFLAVAISTLQNVESFQARPMVPPTRSAVSNRALVPPHHRSITSSVAPLNAASIIKDLLTKDNKSGGVKSIQIKNIERDWTWKEEGAEDYVAEGDFKIDAFIPEGKVKGCVFFMHGFSQYPVAYKETLEAVAESANVAVLACRTGLTSGIVLSDVKSKPLSFITDRTWPQFALQRALSQDTVQCIKMVLENDPTFKEYGITKNLPLGLAGHSMGGGLCFTVAEQCPQVKHLFAMAPAEGVDAFKPLPAIESKDFNVKNSMLLAGTWDLIAKADKIAAMSKASNEKRSDSSILVDIKRGIHTGFEDELVIFQLNILKVVGIVGYFLAIVGVIESYLKKIDFFRTKTGQLDGSRGLMKYFFDQMANGGKVTIDGTEKAVDESIKGLFEEKLADKFDIKYGK
jgi:hypothetical protein